MIFHIEEKQKSQQLLCLSSAIVGDFFLYNFLYF